MDSADFTSDPNLIAFTSRWRASQPKAHAKTTLHVSENHAWWRIDQQSPISISHRPVLVQVIAPVLAARAAGSRRFLSAQELIDAGWPGEHMKPSAAKNRLWVAISSLRKLGLGDLLESSAKGYRLRNDVEVRYL